MAILALEVVEDMKRQTSELKENEKSLGISTEVQRANRVLLFICMSV
jgi:hypothetical protein